MLSPTESEISPQDVVLSPEPPPEPEMGPEPVPVSPAMSEPELEPEPEPEPEPIASDIAKPKSLIPSEEGSVSSEISTPSGELSRKESSEDFKKVACVL